MKAPFADTKKDFGIALSGGGSRAIAFHLGCFRALEAHGVLKAANVISAVSGGSVFAAMYAYTNDSFTEFTRRVWELLRRGLNRTAIRCLLSPMLCTKIIVTNLVSRPAALVAKALRQQPPLNRWASRSDALEQALHRLFGNIKLGEPTRAGLSIVFNACDLRTGTAFRFGNSVSGGYRFGEIKNNDISVAHAVACSSAYPIFLPAFDRIYTFIKEGISKQERVIITDGGVYDNLGLSCLEPGRDDRFTLHSYAPEYIVCCNAGHGQFDGKNIPYGFVSRTEAVLESVFRKVQDAALDRLHKYEREGAIRGFILPYLGQQDSSLPFIADDLVRREEVAGYPTNFSAMSSEDIDLISKRGEQLTNLLMEKYWPEIYASV